MTPEGLTTLPSRFGAKETLERLSAEVERRGMTVFARFDHAAGAAAVGLALRPTTVVIFGAAKGGTPLMQAAQTAGIDLPLKALVFEDEAGKCWVAYNEPAWIAKRHVAGAEAQAAVEAMSATLKAVAVAATG